MRARDHPAGAAKETTKRAPARAAAATWSRCVTVPSPSSRPSSRSASSARSTSGVVRVSSIARMPAAAQARAVATASSTSAVRSTGITRCAASCASQAASLMRPLPAPAARPPALGPAARRSPPRSGSRRAAVAPTLSLAAATPHARLRATSSPAQPRRQVRARERVAGAAGVAHRPPARAAASRLAAVERDAPARRRRVSTSSSGPSGQQRPQRATGSRVPKTASASSREPIATSLARANAASSRDVAAERRTVVQHARDARAALARAAVACRAAAAHERETASVTPVTTSIPSRVEAAPGARSSGSSRLPAEPLRQ